MSKQDIINRSIPFFLEHGYQGTKVNELIAYLNVSKGGFYHHFVSKEELAKSVANKLYQNHFHQMKLIFSQGNSLKEKLDALGGLYHQLLKPNGKETWSINSYIFMFEVMKFFPTQQKQLFREYQEMKNMILRAIQSAQDTEEVDPEVQPELAALQLMSIFEGAIQFSTVLKYHELTEGFSTLVSYYYRGIKK